MATAGDAASILAAGAAQEDGGNVTPPGGVRTVPEVAHDNEGTDQAVVRVDDPPPQPVQQQAGAHPRAAGDLRAAAGNAGVRAADGGRTAGYSQVATRPVCGDGGGHAPTSQGDERIRDSNEWGMPDPGDLDVLIENGSVGAFMAFAVLPIQEYAVCGHGHAIGPALFSCSSDDSTRS